MHSQVRGALICGWFIFFYHGRNTENHVSEDKTGAGPIEILLLFQNCVCIGNISSSVNSSKTILVKKLALIVLCVCFPFFVAIKTVLIISKSIFQTSDLKAE